jgi:hypothetical protein
LLDDLRDEEERLVFAEEDDLLLEGAEDLLGAEALLFTDVLVLEEV